MNIISLQFQNINSFAGDTVVLDFSAPAFSNTMFAITGSTGSGKSSILDAITLALFAKAARYKEKINPGEVMNKGKNECFAELCFEVRQKRYKAYWSLQKTTKNHAEQYRPKRHLADGDGTIITTKVHEINQKIEEITGLDYSRFLRSILLAQGQFREFLDASSRDRADLLEKITGGELYSRLGTMAYEKAKQWGKDISDKEAKVQEYSTYDAAQHKQLKLFETEIDVKLSKAKTEQEEISTELKHFTQIIDLRKREVLCSELETKLKREKPQIIALERTLERHKHAALMQEDIVRWKDLLANNTRLKDALKDADQALDDARKEYHHLHMLLLNYCKEKQSTLESEYAQYCSAIDKINLEIDQLNEWLEKHSADASIEKELGAIRRTAEKIRQLTSTSTKVITSLNDIAEKKHEQEKAYVHAKEDIQALEKEKLAVLQEWNAHAAMEACTALLHEYTLHKKQITEKIESEENASNNRITIALQQKKIADLEHERALLIDGEPCPLCGALEHPYATENIDTRAIEPENITSEITEKLKTLRETLQDIDTTLNTLNTTRARIEEYQKRHKEALKLLDMMPENKTENNFDGTLRPLHRLKEDMQAIEGVILKVAEQEDAYGSIDANHRKAENGLSANILIQRYQEEIETLEAENAKISEQMEVHVPEFNKAISPWNISCQSLDDYSNCVETLEERVQTFQVKKQKQSRLCMEQEKFERLRKDNRKVSNSVHEEISILEKELETCQATIDIDPLELSLEAFDIETELKRSSIRETGVKLVHAKEREQAEKAQLLKNGQEREQEIQHRLEEKLQKYNFSDIEECSNALLPDTQEVTERIAKHYKDEAMLEARTSDIQKELASFTNADGQSIAALSLGALEKEEQELQRKEKCAHEKIQSLSEQRGENRKQQEQAEQEKKKRKTLQDDLAQTKKDSLAWIELSKLIGSADGSTFSRFAQGLTINHLLSIANNNLKTLNPRYALRRSSLSKDLEFSILDRFQAEAERPTQSLSGGESFLLSLALALALSELMSNQNRIECLFIDEGFGSLDQDSLDMALSALENLRLENRVIGIISHVEALKDRIPTQIQVFQKPDGHASIKIRTP